MCQALCRHHLINQCHHISIKWAGRRGPDWRGDSPRLHSGQHCRSDLRMPRWGATKASRWSVAGGRGPMDVAGTEACGTPTLTLGGSDKCPQDSEIKWRILQKDSPLVSCPLFPSQPLCVLLFNSDSFSCLYLLSCSSFLIFPLIFGISALFHKSSHFFQLGNISQS